jgi:hypothetical protein
LSSASRVRALSTSKMPPQQHDRLLDLIDDALDFRAHDIFPSAAAAACESLLNIIEYERLRRSGKGNSIARSI